MSLAPVAYILSLLFFGNLVFQVIPILTALIYQEQELLPALFLSLGVSSLFPLLFLIMGIKPILAKEKIDLTHKESFLIVVGAWFFLALTGAFPYYFTETIPSFTDAFFESISGYTTTGATIIVDIESLPKAILLWRSFTHWIGGMGIVVFTLALLPALGVGGLQMYKAEVPGPIPDKLAPQVKQTAIILWQVYLIITLVEIILLYISGLDLFDSINHAFATLATGGFSTKNSSIAAMNPQIQWIITLFMIIAGANFALHYRFIKGDFKVYFRDAEFRFYFIGIFVSAIFIAMNILYMQYFRSGRLPDALVEENVIRHAFFQVSSIVTSTGFATDDFEKWPHFSQVIIFILMFFGGSAGSTGGGIKQMRILVLIKVSFDEVRRLIHPRAVFNTKIDKKPLQQEVQRSIVAFIIIYILILALSMLIISLWDIDLITSLTAALACLGNIGPGLGLVGPTDNYAWLPWPVKWILSFLMLLGRLEIFPVLVLLAPSTWRK